MGLDLALAVVIVIVAFRGWFQGFVGQAVRLVSLVACVYLADWVRRYGRPYVDPYLSTIQPDLVDRLLWWVSAVATYIVLVGIALLIVKMTRRPEIPGISQSGRNDQFAGFMLGAIKGLAIAALLAAGILKYGAQPIETVSWAQEQVKTSWALRFSETYQPVPTIWATRPVRHFVDHIQRMGLQKPGEEAQSAAATGPQEESPVRTASRTADRDSTGGGGSASETATTARSAVPAEAPLAERP
jgi:uncharacterized membrane protein required for colicin V production